MQPEAQPTVGEPALRGWRVLVPRAAGRGEELAACLRAAGATPLLVPLIAFTTAPDPAPLAQAGSALAAGRFSWVVFSSATAVDYLLAAATAAGTQIAQLAATQPQLRCAVVGAATARAAAKLGFNSCLQPPASHRSAAGLLEVFPPPAQPGSQLLFPRAAAAAPTLAQGLRAKGYAVSDPIAYSTAPVAAPGLAAQLAAGQIDAICFSSPSMVRHLLQQCPNLPPHVLRVSIGPTTSAALDAAGFPAHAHAATASAPGLVAALIAGARTWQRPRAGGCH